MSRRESDHKQGRDDVGRGNVGGLEGRMESVSEVSGVLKELKSDQAAWREVRKRCGA